MRTPSEVVNVGDGVRVQCWLQRQAPHDLSMKALQKAGSGALLGSDLADIESYEVRGGRGNAHRLAIAWRRAVGKQDKRRGKPNKEPPAPAEDQEEITAGPYATRATPTS